MPTVAELRAELGQRGLDTSGKKAELLERLASAALGGDRSGGGGAKRSREDGMAQEDALLVDTLAKQLECPICLDTILPPIGQCDAGHTLCAVCKEKLPAPRKCPECRVLLGAGRNLALEQLAAGRQFSCPNAAGGCEETIPYERLKDHVAGCDFRVLKCPRHTCNFEGSWKDLLEHMVTTKCWPCSAIAINGGHIERTGIIWNAEGGFKPTHRGNTLLHDKDAGVGFILRRKAGEVEFPHNNDAQGFASFHVLFLGPESKRTGFNWTLTLGDDDGVSLHAFSAEPTSTNGYYACTRGATSLCEVPRFPYFGAGVLTLPEEQLELYRDGNRVPFRIRFDRVQEAE